MELPVRIAGLDLLVACSDPAVVASLERTFAPFAVTDAVEPMRVELQSTGPAPAPSPSGQRALPRVARTAHGLNVRGEDFSADVEPSLRRARIRGPAERFGLDTVLKLLVADSVQRRGGLVIHGVAVATGEKRAALFTGPSGAGKSTLGAWASSDGLSVLADELVVVAPEEGGFVAEGTPWNVGRPLRARLGLVGVLGFSGSSSHALEEFPPADVLRTLISNVMLVEDTADERAEAFRRCAALLGSVRTGRLVFARTSGVGEALAEALR